MASIRKGQSQLVRLQFLVWYICSWTIKNLMICHREMTWRCSAFSVLKLNGLIQTNKNKTSTWKTGKRERGWERHERHERSNEVRSDEEEDAGTGLQGEGVHELGMNMVHVHWSTEGGHKEAFISAKTEWHTVSQVFIYTNAETAQLVLILISKSMY